MPTSARATEEGSPITFLDAIPEGVVHFARTLVAGRVLASPLELQNVPPQPALSRTRLTHDLDQIIVVSEYAAWLEWIVHWIAEFSEFTGAQAIRLRMSHARFPTCPRFHIDGVELRLIATLTGPGTEWLHASDVAHDAGGYVSQVYDPQVIQQMPPRSIGLFKGARYNPKIVDAVVHRSPASLEDRVIVTLDVAA